MVSKYLFLLIATYASLACVSCLPLQNAAVEGATSHVSFSGSSIDPVDGVENTAKILIKIDQDVEKALQSEPISLNHFYLAQSEVSSTLVNGSDSSGSAAVGGDREEKFSLVLQDLSKIEDDIKEAIQSANSNRQYRLVMRLRPLLSYVNHIHRNMEMLRTRVVAIATLSNIAVSVTEVIDQFGDVMTSSLGLSSGIVRQPLAGLNNTGKQNEAPPKANQETAAAPNTATSGPASSSRGSNSATPDAPAGLVTTLSYTEVDSENFFKNIIHHETK